MTYVNAINKTAIACGKATDPLVAAAFADVFHALPPPADDKLTVLARQREFIATLPQLLARPLNVPDTAVNTEDNLSSQVVKRNLYRLGFPETLLSEYHGELDELVKHRNNIAHGADGDPVKEADHERLRKAVFQAMDEMTLSVVAAVENTQFLKPAAPAAANNP